jgi:hypothetical protein
MSFRRFIDRHTIFTITLLAGCRKNRFDSSPATDIELANLFSILLGKCGAEAKGGAPPSHAGPSRRAACSDKTVFSQSILYPSMGSPSDTESSDGLPYPLWVLVTRLVAGPGCTRFEHHHATRICSDGYRLLLLVIGRVDDRQ